MIDTKTLRLAIEIAEVVSKDIALELLDEIDRLKGIIERLEAQQLQVSNDT